MKVWGTFLPRILGIDSLVDDGVARLFMAFLALAAVAVLTPILSFQTRVFYLQYLLVAPFVVYLLIVLWHRRYDKQEPSERWFWSLIFAAFMGARAVVILTPFADRLLASSTALQDLGGLLPFLVFYGGLILALEVRPSTRQDSVPYRLRIVGWAGSVILLFSLLMYFLVAPKVWLDSSERLLSYNLALFVALDAYIIIRLWHLISLAVMPQWRAIYSWLLIAAAFWSLGDLLNLLISEQVLQDPRWGAALGLMWPAVFTATAFAARVFEIRLPGVIPVAAPYYPLGMGPLAIYVVAPLLLHVTLYHFGEPEPDLRTSRDSLVLVSTALLASLALIYHRFLRIENYRLAVEEVQSRHQMEHLAFHDELTGLPNRNLFHDRMRMAIAEARRHGTKCGILFCDLDNFKVINDSLGHEAGDELLVEAAHRMRKTVRAHDTVARLGGDEFAIIVQDLHQCMDAAVIAEKLLGSLREPLGVGSKTHVLNGSVGISLFPDDGEEEEILLKHADTAMYQAKLHGRNTYRLFTQAMNDAAQERLTIEQGLRTGMLEDQFTVFYQPIVDLGSSQVVSYEALLRWKHPERGYIPPVNFIDIAEQTGLIVELGQWVLESACSWAAQLDRTDDGALPSISVNISLRQLRDPHFAQGVLRVLTATQLDPQRLVLEITESMALTIDYTAEILTQLRAGGIRIAIDDFGTGYATLSSLQELPVDVVKIDRSFVKDMETGSVSEAIVLAIVSMARALDFFVIAEGVETETELQLIMQSQCDAVQGYYISHPLPPEELELATFADKLPRPD